MKSSSPSVHDAIREWVDLYSDALYRRALYKTGDRELAEDLVQDTFVAALSSAGGFKGNSSPKTWLYAILNNKITDHYRKQFRSGEVSTSKLAGASGDDSILERFFTEDGGWKPGAASSGWHETDEHLLDDAGFNAALGRCMEKLPGRWLAAVRLKYLEERDGREVCKELEITPTNFWQILHRAKLQLKACLEQSWFK